MFIVADLVSFKHIITKGMFCRPLKYLKIQRETVWTQIRLISQVHNFQKLKNISLKAVNFFSNKKQK